MDGGGQTDDDEALFSEGGRLDGQRELRRRALLEGRPRWRHLRNYAIRTPAAVTIAQQQLGLVPSRASDAISCVEAVDNVAEQVEIVLRGFGAFFPPFAPFRRAARQKRKLDGRTPRVLKPHPPPLQKQKCAGLKTAVPGLDSWRYGESGSAPS